jgi:hypothetical protein
MLQGMNLFAFWRQWSELMKALVIVAGLFFAIFGGIFGYYAASDPGHEYDLKLVLPVDARLMPRPVTPPSIRSWAASEEETAPPEGRAEASKTLALPPRPPVEFDGPGAASESARP